MGLHRNFKTTLIAVTIVGLSACSTLERSAPNIFNGAAEVTPVVTEHSFGLQCLGSIIEESALQPVLIDVDRIRDRTIPSRLNDTSRLSQAGEWLVHTAISKLETPRVRSTIGRTDKRPALTIAGAWTQDDELLRRSGGLLDLSWLRGRLNLKDTQAFDYIAGDFVSLQDGVVIFSTAIGVMLGSRRIEARLLVENGNEYAEIGFDSRWADGPQLAQRRIAEAAILVHVANYYEVDYRPCLESGWGDPASFRQNLEAYASMNKSAQHSAAQQELIRLGYNPGNADGVWGATSHKALLAYQADHRLPTTGRLSPVLFALLTAQR